MSSINGHSFLNYTTVTTMQNAATGTGNGTSITLTPADIQVGITILGATIPSSTIVFEVSNDGGTTWELAFLEDALVASGIGTLVNVVAVTTSLLRYRYRPVPGITNIRARVSVYVTGSVTVTGTKLTSR